MEGLACKKEELSRLNTWIKRHNRLVDLTLKGKQPLGELDADDPNPLLLQTYRFARELFYRTGVQLHLMDENTLVQAVHAYVFLHPELIKEKA